MASIRFALRLIWCTYLVLALLAVFFINAQTWVPLDWGFYVVLGWAASIVLGGLLLLAGSILGTERLLREAGSRGLLPLVTVAASWVGAAWLLRFGWHLLRS
jgi:hypothetical protein